MVERPTPAGFKSTVKSSTVRTLPLVRDTSRRWKAGWCTYSDHFELNPDIEIFCGGENDKAASAAACWRQGNLLHFGFEQSPAELNEEGQQLLLNCIAYISRFKEDRPIAITPSVFAGPVGLPRTYLDRRIESGNLTEAAWIVSPELLTKISALASDELKKWHQENRGYLRPNPAAEYKLYIDEEARTVGVGFDQIAFLEKCISGLDGSHAQAARTLLARYGPTETESFKSKQEWSNWLNENKDYLFFSDQGDYRWYIDPLAKKRGVPSAQLRGPARASK